MNRTETLQAWLFAAKAVLPTCTDPEPFKMLIEQRESELRAMSTLLKQQMQSLLEQHALSDVLRVLSDIVCEPLHGVAHLDNIERSYMSVGIELRWLAGQMARNEDDKP